MIHCTFQFITRTGVPGRISTTQRKLLSSNTYYRRQNWIVRQMNYPLLVRFIWLLLYYTVYPPKTELLSISDLKRQFNFLVC